MYRTLLTLALVALATACTQTAGAPSSPPAESAPEALAVRTDSLLISADSLRFDVAVGYPQITGSSESVSTTAVAAVNAVIRDSVMALADRFRPTETVPPDAPPYRIVTIEGGTDDVFLGGDLFSGLVATYVYLGGAHGSNIVAPVNRDLRSGAAIHLGDLFRADTPWADTLSAQAERGLVRKATGNDIAATVAEARGWLSAEGYRAEAMRNARFTLGRDSLAIHFVDYEVSAYAFGPSRVPIAYRDLAPLMRSDGVAGRLQASR